MPLPRSILAPVDPEDRDLRVVQGSMPAGISGEIVISAPHASTVGPPHAFFGAGMTYRLSLDPGTFGAATDTHAWRQAWIDSPSARLQHKRPGVFDRTMMGVQSPFGLVNAANTAPLPWGDRLFMTWDVGRPVEVDPVSLRYLGEVGHVDQWQVFDLMPGPVLPMITSTAHPIMDPDRDCLWTVNTYLGALYVVRWDGEGAIRRWPVDGAVIPQSVHTITQTRDWLVVGDCAFKVEPQVLSGGERTEPANPDEPIYLIRKADLEATAPGSPVPCRTHRLAPEMNHYYAAYDDTDGVVVMFEHTENADHRDGRARRGHRRVGSTGGPRPRRAVRIPDDADAHLHAPVRPGDGQAGRSGPARRGRRPALPPALRVRLVPRGLGRAGGIPFGVPRVPPRGDRAADARCLPRPSGPVATPGRGDVGVAPDAQLGRPPHGRRVRVPRSG